MNRPLFPLRLLLDLDGPFFDFDQAVVELCAELGIEFDCEHGQWKHRYISDHIPSRADRARVRKEIESRRWFRDLRPVEGAIDGVRELDEVFDEVFICTKPLEANLTGRDDKADAVRRHLGEEWERRLVITPDKSIVIGSVLLDDAPKLEWLPRAEWEPAIFTMSWNGPGSDWARFPHWTWGDDPQVLVDIAKSSRHRIGWPA